MLTLLEFSAKKADGVRKEKITLDIEWGLKAVTDYGNISAGGSALQLGVLLNS